MDFRFLVPTLALALAACSAEPPAPAATSTEAAAPAGARADAREPDEYEADDVLLRDHDVAHMVVKEAFVTASTPEENIDSPASWLQDGKRMLVASAKATDQLVVYDGDTGQRLRTVGGTGTALGQLQRPNGVATIDDRYLFVVERDNHRVQMFQLPDFTPLLAFGADALQQPYGLWVQPKGEGYEVLVSDAYMAGEDAQGEDIIPPLAQLDRRFRRYELTQAGGKWTARDAGAFGDTGAAGAIRVPESLFGDAANNRLLVAEEDVPTGTRLREYDLQGRYKGRDVGADRYAAQAEGIALWQCDDGSGYWITTDQFKDRSLFHVFDRRSLAHVGSFAGKLTANTDGVWLDARGDGRFPGGVMYALHDDQAVAAFDWRDIAAALKLPACAR